MNVFWTLQNDDSSEPPNHAEHLSWAVPLEIRSSLRLQPTFWPLHCGSTRIWASFFPRTIWLETTCLELQLLKVTHLARWIFGRELVCMPLIQMGTDRWMRVFNGKCERLRWRHLPHHFPHPTYHPIRCSHCHWPLPRCQVLEPPSQSRLLRSNRLQHLQHCWWQTLSYAPAVCLSSSVSHRLGRFCSVLPGISVSALIWREDAALLFHLINKAIPTSTTITTLLVEWWCLMLN